MENATSVLLENGLLGAIIVVLGWYAWTLSRDIKDLNTARIKDKDLEIQRKEKDSEQYINVIEKSLNGLTAVEKIMFENRTILPENVFVKFKEANAPLIEETKKILDLKKNE